MASRQKSKAAESWHRLHVYNDIEFITDIRALPKRKLPDSFGDYDRLAEKWDVSADYVDFVHERDWSDFDANKNVSGNIVHQNPKRPGFIATLNVDVTKEQILDVYKEVQRLRNELGTLDKKYKKPDDTELLYAISRARKSGKTFNDMSKEYLGRTLPHYSKKPINRFATGDDLKKFYYEHYK